MDRDKIERENLKNQPWMDVNIGQSKANVLSSILWKTQGVMCESVNKEIKSLSDILGNNILDSHIFVDCFDNHKSRELFDYYAKGHKLPIIHAGFSENLFKCDWQMITSKSSNREPICDRRELSTIVRLGSTFLSEAVFFYLTKKEKLCYIVTQLDEIITVEMKKIE